MIWGFDSFLNILKRNSTEKIEGGVYVSWYGNTILAIVITLLLNDLLVILFHSKPVIYSILLTILLLYLFFYLSNRRAMFGVTENNFVYIKLKSVLCKEKEVYEIPIKKVRYFDVKKMFFVTFVKLYFISDVGKFTKAKFTISPFILGFDRKEYKKNHKIVLDKMLGIQKVLDKGDF